MKGAVQILGLVLALALLAGCAESRASRMVERAQQLARQGKYDDAIGLLEGVQSRFEGTEAAKGSRKLLVLYRGLREADLKEDRRRAKDDLTAIARALYNYRDRLKRYPSLLSEMPSSGSLHLVDPWGRDYLYLPSADRNRYRLECRGRDGAPGGTGDDQDLRIVNGDFVVDLPWEDR